MTDEPTPFDPLIEFLRHTGASCPLCRYHLRGVKSDRCPECGYRLKLDIARPAFGFGWWLAGLFGLACTAALLLVVLWTSIPKIAESVNNPDLQALVRSGFASSAELPNWRAIFPLSAALLGCLALFGLIIGSHRRLSAWPLGRQIACGVAMLLLPLIALVLIAVLAA